jgi:lipoprotein-anchoring transpeptidase ErfK/SrfK
MRRVILKVIPYLALSVLFIAGASILTAQEPEDPISIELSPYIQVQILLDQAGFSPGEIDGRYGYNTLKALKAFQKVRGLEETGLADEETLEALGASRNRLLAEYRITPEDLEGPFAEIPSGFTAKSRLQGLPYSSVEEAIAEKFHVSPELLFELNPTVLLEVGERLIVPNVRSDLPLVHRGKLSVIVSGTTSDLTVQLNGQIIFYAPISHGGERGPLPVGKRKVQGIIKNPHYRYNPKLFWDANPKDSPALLPPGPNNPVGKVWIALNVRHYGLHGTPEPSSIGYANSHGCVRLTNWDAQQLSEILKPGTEILFKE